ncbi:MAG: endolytic transglycosylase MltG [Gemmatimonadaceae bacterium]|nr:endolytic transglycosylase MltG [Gemmatimonadaceae bacterium]
MIARAFRTVAACALAGVVVASCGDDAKGKERVRIPKGSSFRAAAESLAAHGLVANARVFGLYAKLRGRDRSLRYGTYVLARGSSWNALLADLRSGKGIVHAVTIPEGWTLQRMIPVLAEAVEIPRESLFAAVRDSALRERLDVPTPTLEGYLFPDSYEFGDNATARDVVATMVARFEQVWQDEWTERAKAMALTRHDLVTLASIVEGEVRRREEGPVVAAVYLNRLRARMPLQADPTVNYALKRFPGRVLYKDLKVKSAYNTYVNPGLPPGPIGAPGAASLEAAAHPADVPYKFFVAHPDGHHEFRTTYREHLAAIRMVRATAAGLREERAMQAALDSAARAAGAPLDSVRRRPRGR